jgi:hypothetical protein
MAWAANARIAAQMLSRPSTMAGILMAEPKLRAGSDCGKNVLTLNL